MKLSPLKTGIFVAIGLVIIALLAFIAINIANANDGGMRGMVDTVGDVKTKANIAKAKTNFTTLTTDFAVYANLNDGVDQLTDIAEFTSINPVIAVGRDKCGEFKLESNKSGARASIKCAAGNTPCKLTFQVTAKLSSACAAALQDPNWAPAFKIAEGEQFAVAGAIFDFDDITMKATKRQ